MAVFDCGGLGLSCVLLLVVDMLEEALEKERVPSIRCFWTGEGGSDAIAKLVAWHTIGGKGSI